MNRFFRILCVGLVATCVAATSSAEVRDVTSQYLQNADMEQGVSFWISEGDRPLMRNTKNPSLRVGFHGMNQGVLEAWNSNVNLPLGDSHTMQNIENLPNGTYVFGAYVGATQQSAREKVSENEYRYWSNREEIHGVSLFANGNEVPVATDNPDFGEKHKWAHSSKFNVATTVTDGTLQVGLKVENTNANYVVWDNVTLYYFGDMSEADALDAMAELDMDMVVEIADTMLSVKMNVDTLCNLSDAVYEARRNATTAATLWDDNEDLFWGIGLARKSAIDYENLKKDIEDAWLIANKDVSEWTQEWTPDWVEMLKEVLYYAEEAYEMAEMNRADLAILRKELTWAAGDVAIDSLYNVWMNLEVYTFELREKLDEIGGVTRDQLDMLEHLIAEVCDTIAVYEMDIEYPIEERTVNPNDLLPYIARIKNAIQEVEDNLLTEEDFFTPMPVYLNRAEDGWVEGAEWFDESKKIMGYTSPLYRFGSKTEKLRLTVGASKIGSSYFCLSELEFFDANGEKIKLTAENVTSNADHNALNHTPDGGGIEALLDNDYNSFFHSAWQNAPAEAHYLEVTLPNGGYDAFSFRMLSRSNSNGHNQSHSFPGEMVIGPPSVLDSIVYPRVEVTEVTLNYSRAELNEVGATLQLEAMVNPDNATDKGIVWSSSNEKLVTVDQGGLVTVVAAGTEEVEIRATAANGVFASCRLSVCVEEEVPNSLELLYVLPYDSASVKTIDRIQFIFAKEVIVSMPEGGIEVENTMTGEIFATSLYEDEWQDDKNMVQLQFESGVSLTPGIYTYTIPAGMIKGVDGEEFAGKTFTFTVVEMLEIVNVTPANGEVEKLETLQFTFDRVVDSVDLSKFSLWDSTWTNQLTLKDEVVYSDDRKTVTVELENPVAAQGLYYWDIYFGAFVGEDGSKSEYMSLYFEIVDNTPSYSFKDTNGYLNDGDRRLQLGNRLDIEFRNVENVELVEGAVCVVALPDGEELTAIIEKHKRGKNRFFATFDEKFTEEGFYAFCVPDGSFIMDGVENEELLVVVELYSVPAAPLEIVSVTPVTDEQGYLVAVQVEYDQQVALGYDEDWQAISGNINLMDDKGNAINMMENWNSSLSLTTLEYVIGSYDENWQIVTTPLTEPGTYTLDLSQIVVQYGYNPETWEFTEQGYCEGIFTYIVEGNSVKPGDVNSDGYYTMADVVMMVNAVLEKEQGNFNAAVADMNADYAITMSDVIGVLRLVLGDDSAMAPARNRGVVAAPEMSVGELGAMGNGRVALPVALNNSEAYSAFQLDVVLPAGMEFAEAVLTDRAKVGHVVAWNTLSDGTTRVVAYAMDNAAFRGNEGALLNLVLETSDSQPVDAEILLADGLFTTSGGAEHRATDVSIMMRADVTDIEGDYQTSFRTYGKDGAVVVECGADTVVSIYTFTGKLVQQGAVETGKNIIVLPAGIYMVNGRKVIVR